MQADAHKQAEAIGLLDAVRVIARSGSRKDGPQWVKDWNGLRFYYGERSGDPDRAFAEVTALSYAYAKGADGKAFANVDPQHDDKVPGWKAMHDHTVSGSMLLYEHSDVHGTRALRPGAWVDAVIQEADRIRKTPPMPTANVVEDPALFASFSR
jgi:hypothetical protein